MTSTGALVHIDNTDTRLDALRARYPQAARHDGVHYYFAAIPDGYESDPRLVHIGDIVDPETGEQLTGDGLAWALAQLLADPANTQIIIGMSRAQGKSLYAHPAWRIWCANYNEDSPATLAEDWAYIGNMLNTYRPDLADQWPEYTEEMTPAQGREIIYQAIVNNTEE